MKISKITLLILGIGIMVIIGVALYFSYAQYQNERDALYTTIDSLQQKYATVSGEKRLLEPQVAQLQQKIAELKSSFDKAKGAFPSVTIQSIEYDEEISGLAEDSAVTIIRLTASDDTELKEGNSTYYITDFSIEVQGDRANLLDFLHRVCRSAYFSAALINSVSLKEESVPSPSPTPGIEPGPPAVNFASLLISISVFRYEGN